MGLISVPYREADLGRVCAGELDRWALECWESTRKLRADLAGSWGWGRRRGRHWVCLPGLNESLGRSLPLAPWCFPTGIDLECLDTGVSFVWWPLAGQAGPPPIQRSQFPTAQLIHHRNVSWVWVPQSPERRFLAFLGSLSAGPELVDQ